MLSAIVRTWQRTEQVSGPMLVAAAALVLVGSAAAFWAWRTMPAAERRDHLQQRADGHVDGLPAGATRRGGRIRLSSQQAWTRWLLPVLGTVMLLLGALVVAAALTEADVEMLIGGGVVLAMGVLMFWVRYRVGGVTVTIGPEGVTRTRPHRTVGWRDLVAAHVARQQLHLVVGREVLGAETVSIPIGVLEIDPVRLLELIANERNLALGLPYGTPLPSPDLRGR